MRDKTSRNRAFFTFFALAVFAMSATGLSGVAACSSSSSTAPPISLSDSGAPPADAVVVLADGATVPALRAFAAPGDPGANAIWISASGEVLSLAGYAFPPVNAGDTAFVDGWQFEFARVIVTFDDVTIATTPDLVPTDQSQTGPVVARARGPWAVDLHKGGALPGKGGGGEQAAPIAVITGQDDGTAFDTTQTYAFGFSTVPATTAAFNVNLDSDGLADYAEMIARGYTVFYVGTATFNGGATTPGVVGSVNGCASPGATNYDFAKLPRVVNFRFGFRSPTTYVNCQDPELQGNPVGDDESPRGVQTKANGSVIVQATFHTDHPFWESVIHDSPAHFDQIAARYVGAATTPTATIEDFAGDSFLSFVDGLGAPVPWRSCIDGYTARPGTMSFDSQSIPVNPADNTGASLRDYRDFMTYDQSTQGHLNADGLCFIRRNYPSPP